MFRFQFQLKAPFYFVIVYWHNFSSKPVFWKSWCTLGYQIENYKHERVLFRGKHGFGFFLKQLRKRPVKKDAFLHLNAFLIFLTPISNFWTLWQEYLLITSSFCFVLFSFSYFYALFSREFKQRIWWPKQVVAILLHALCSLTAAKVHNHLFFLFS